jgi:D-alanyl-D-alanine carboxypeptidase
MANTRERLIEARATPVRGATTRPPARPWFRAPFAAAALSLLVIAAPDLTLAPTLAGGPWLGQPRPIDSETLRVVPRVVPVPEDRRTAGPEPTVTVTPAAPQFQAALDAARRKGPAFGVTFAAVRDGELVWAGSSGVTRQGGNLLPDSEMVIGSVTKTFVAATVLQLAEEGRLDIDSSVRRHLPELRRVSREITIEQLLDHTSGLADLYNDTTRVALEKEPMRTWSSDEVLRTLHAPWYKPGEGWAYANTNYHLLGLIVERVTGNTLEDEIARRFLEPLGLDATRSLTAESSGQLGPAWSSIFWASGSMSSSATDLARWGDALLAGDVLDPLTKDLMTSVNRDDYGLGVRRIELPRRVGYGHTGLLNTYTAIVLYLPGDDVTIAMLVNRTGVDLYGMLMERPAGGGPSLLRLAIENGSSGD